MVISLEPYDQLRWGFHQYIALKVGPTLQLKTVFSFNASSDSFCWIASHLGTLQTFEEWGLIKVHRFYSYEWHHQKSYKNKNTINWLSLFYNRCQICGKGFVCGSDLNKHEKRHTAEKPYWCSTCGRNFSSDEQLNKHMEKAHLCDKPFICKQCGKSFAKAAYLKLHEATHCPASLGKVS